MKKKPFAYIEYINCSPDYSSTICELSDIETHIECFKLDNEDVDETGFNDWKASGYLPAIVINLVMMTDAEYIKWFTDNVEANA